MRSSLLQSPFTLVALAAFCCCCAIAAGQAPDDSSGPDADRRGPVENVSETEGPVAIKPLDGKPIVEPIAMPPVLPDDVAPYHISKFAINGKIVGNRAELTAEIHVFVTRPNVWQPVALRMPEARIVDRRYEGTGLHAPLQSANRADGITWTLLGTTDHRLTLDLHVPVKRTPNGRTLALTLPRLHRFISGTVDVELPGSNLEVSSSESELAIDSTVDGNTSVEAVVPGDAEPGPANRLTITWQPSGTAAAEMIKSVESNLTLSVDRDNSVMRIDAAQTLRGVPRSMRSFRMDLPEGFEIETVSGPHYFEHRIEQSSNEARSVTVQLTDEPHETTTLLWRLRHPYATTPESVRLNGFTIDEVASHTGLLHVKRVDGYRVSVDWANIVGGRRSTPTQSDAIAALSLSSFPIDVPVRMRRERPSIAVAPRTSIAILPTEARLIAEFPIQVDRGEVDELTLDWSQPDSGAWSNLIVSSPPGAELSSSESQTVINLASAITDSATVIVEGSREINTRSDLTFSLPRMMAETEAPTRLSLYAADAIEAEVDAIGETYLQRDPATLFEEKNGKTTHNGRDAERLVDRYRVFGEPAEISVLAKLREPVISARTELEIDGHESTSPGAVLIDIVQNISVNVTFGRVSEVNLEIPVLLTSQVSNDVLVDKIGIAVNGSPVARERVRATETGAAIVLDQPSNDLDLTIGPYQSPTPTQGNDQVIPLISLSSVPFDEIGLQVRRDSLFAVKPNAIREPTRAENPTREWSQTPLSPKGFVSWVLSLPPDMPSIPVAVDASARAASALFTVDRLDMQVAREQQGFSCRCEYHLSDLRGTAILGLPVAAIDARFTWNGQGVSDVESMIDFEGLPNSHATFRIGTGRLRSGRLLVEYLVPTEPLAAFNTERLPLPVLPKRVRVARTWVELLVPSSQHLIQSPAPLVPEFRWVRRGFLWMRQSVATLFPGAEQPLTSQSRRYLFSSSVPPAAIEFRTAEGSLLVLIGATGTFLLAFVLYRFPGLRQLPVFLAVGLVITVAGLFDAELLKVMLQPAVLGVTLALIAVAIDRFRRHPTTGSPVLTVYSESEFTVDDQLAGAATETNVPVDDKREPANVGSP